MSSLPGLIDAKIPSRPENNIIVLKQDVKMYEKCKRPRKIEYH